MWQHQGCLTQPHVGECNDADTSNVTTTFACRSHHPPACVAVHLHLFLPPLSTTSTITHTYAQSEAVSAHHNLGRTSVTKSTHPTSFHVLALEFGVTDAFPTNPNLTNIISVSLDRSSTCKRSAFPPVQAKGFRHKQT